MYGRKKTSDPRKPSGPFPEVAQYYKTLRQMVIKATGHYHNTRSLKKMNSSRIVNGPLSHGIYEDLRPLLPRIAKYLNCEDKNLMAMPIEALPVDFTQDASLLDKIDSTEALRDDFCYVSVNNPFNSTEKMYPPGRGLHYCSNAEIKYVIYSTESPDYSNDAQEGFYIINKEQYTKFSEHIYAKHAKFNDYSCPPILEDGILEDVLENTIGVVELKDKLKEYQVPLSRGIILEGSPGNGKTMLCRWIKKICIEKKIDYGVITSADLKVSFQNGTLEKLFNRYTIGFFDDVDISFFQRKEGGHSDIACDMLSAMDGLSKNKVRVWLFTTNEQTNSLDKAFLRPQRIDEIFILKKPQREHRERLINVLWPEEIRKYLNEPGRMKVFLDKTNDFSFAQVDAIKRLLVVEKIKDSGVWNQDLVFEQFDKTERPQPTKKRAGFHTGEDEE